MAPMPPVQTDRSAKPARMEPEPRMPRTSDGDTKQPEDHSATLEQVLQGLDAAVAEAIDPSHSNAAAGATVILSPDPHDQVPRNASDTGDNSGDGELSIEQYMQDLLQRTNGRSSASPSGSAGGAAAGAPTRPRPDATSRSATGAAASIDTEAPEAAPPAEAAKPIVKRIPERRESLENLRDVANLTTHQAINLFSSKQLIAKSRGTLLTAMVLQVVSFAIVATAPAAGSLAFFAAVVAFIASAVWTLRFAGFTNQLRREVVGMRVAHESAQDVEVGESSVS